MKDGKINGPVFRTFDTSSVNYKQTQLEMDPRILQNILGLIQRSEKPLMAGSIALWFDLRMNYVIEALRILIDQNQVAMVDRSRLEKFGLSEHAEAYWTSEKLSKHI